MRQQHPKNKGGFIQTPAALLPNKNKGTSFAFSSFITHPKKNETQHWSTRGFLFLWSPSCHAIAPQGHYQCHLEVRLKTNPSHSIGEGCGGVIPKVIPAKPNSACPHAGEAKAAITLQPGCKIKLNKRSHFTKGLILICVTFPLYSAAYRKHTLKHFDDLTGNIPIGNIIRFSY